MAHKMSTNKIPKIRQKEKKVDLESSIKSFNIVNIVMYR